MKLKCLLAAEPAGSGTNLVVRSPYSGDVVGEVEPPPSRADR
jgi:hypothetical protein